MTAVALGLYFAMLANASVILHSDLESLPRWDASGGGSYPFFRRLFNLYSFPTTSELGVIDPSGHLVSMSHPAGRLQVVTSLHCQDAVEHAQKSCNQIMMLPTGHERACLTGDGTGQDYCVFAGVPGAFQTARPLLQVLYSHGFYSRMPLVHFRKTAEVTAATAAVAWYIRNDDIQLYGGKATYWSNLVANVIAGLHGRNMHHYVLSQNPILKNDSDFGFLHELVDFSWTALSGLPVDVAMYHLIAADVIVHSGSSFSMVANLVADSTQVSLFALPKESRNERDGPWETYWLDGNFAISSDGTIADADIPRLRAAVEHRVDHKPLQWLVPI